MRGAGIGLRDCQHVRVQAQGKGAAAALVEPSGAAPSISCSIRIASLPTCTSVSSQLNSGLAIEHPLLMIMGQRITA